MIQGYRGIKEGAMAKTAAKRRTKKTIKKHDARSLPELVHSIVEKGANSTEEIHQQVAALPLKILENLMPKAAREVDKIQHRSVGAVYDTIRSVNDEVEKLAEDILERAMEARKGKASARKQVVATAKKGGRKAASGKRRSG
jgi:hypothetical protein